MSIIEGLIIFAVFMAALIWDQASEPKELKK